VVAFKPHHSRRHRHGAFYINTDNWHPFAPTGFGVLKACLRSFCVYRLRLHRRPQRVQNPKRDLPLGMFLSLAICTVLYIVIALVLTGMVNHEALQVGDPLAFVFGPQGANLPWLRAAVSISAVVAMTTVLLVFQLGQPRIWMSMSRDGLLPPIFSAIHPRFKTPWFATLITGLLVAVPALFMNLTEVTDLTSITPHQVWLAMVAVCTVSYASYLLQRYVTPFSAGLLTEVVGGFYSSTATTVVLARRVRAELTTTRQAQTGIILATAVMYLRLLIIIALFNPRLAFAVAPALLILSVLGLLAAAGAYWTGHSQQHDKISTGAPTNPLELGAAAVFAVLFIAISVASSWAALRFGTAGIYVLAVIVGVSDIDPFVLSLAQHGAGEISSSVGVIAILLATSSNNLLKALYVVAYSGGRLRTWPVATLALLAACGIGAAVALV
jgi:uncharacterized membrane protein (DUF4010 family)